MIKNLSLILTAVCVAPLVLGTLNAAETSQPAASGLPKVQKLENVTWHNLWYVQFKANKMEQGFAIADRFEKAAQKAKLPGLTVLKMRSGKWNILTIFTLPDGVQGLAWLASPQDVQFFQALAEQEGGADKALALWAEYTECIQDQLGEVAVASKAQ